MLLLCTNYQMAGKIQHMVVSIVPLMYRAVYLFLFVELVWLPMVEYEDMTWVVLSPFLEYKIGFMSHRSIEDAKLTTMAQTEHYQLLVNRVLQSGIHIWNVLVKVHTKGKPIRKGTQKSRILSCVLSNHIIECTHDLWN